MFIKRLFIIFVFSILVIIGISFAHQKSVADAKELENLITKAKTVNELDYESEIKTIKHILSKYSYKEAFAYAISLPVGYRDYHAVSHYIGQDMFKKLGPNGVARCFESGFMDLYFGCAHGFLSEAIRATDYNIPLIENGCKTITFTTGASECLHIIGHTVMHNLGFSDEAFIKANEICERASTEDIVTRCKDGTIMEITFARLGTDGRGQVPKLDFDPQNPYYPCDLTSNSNCYTLKPEHWLRTLKLPVSQITDYCANAPNQDASSGCFWGLGVILWSESYVSTQSYEEYQKLLEANIKYCQAISQPAGKSRCLQGFNESKSRLSDGTYRDIKHIF